MELAFVTFVLPPPSQTRDTDRTLDPPGQLLNPLSPMANSPTNPSIVENTIAHTPNLRPLAPRSRREDQNRAPWLPAPGRLWRHLSNSTPERARPPLTLFTPGSDAIALPGRRVVAPAARAACPLSHHLSKPLPCDAGSHQRNLGDLLCGATLVRTPREEAAGGESEIAPRRAGRGPRETVAGGVTGRRRARRRPAQPSHPAGGGTAETRRRALWQAPGPLSP